MPLSYSKNAETAFSQEFLAIDALLFINLFTAGRVISGPVLRVASSTLGESYIATRRLNAAQRQGKWIHPFFEPFNFSQVIIIKVSISICLLIFRHLQRLLISCFKSRISYKKVNLYKSEKRERN